MPYHLTFVFRKREQYQKILQLPKEKRPTEFLFWAAPQSKLEEFIDKVLGREDNSNESVLIIDEEEIM